MKLKTVAVCFLIFSLFPVFGYPMKVTFFLGSSTLTRNGKTINLKVGDIVSNGDVIKTSKNGIVELLYDDTSKLTIKENSVVQIGSMNVKDSGAVAVISGEVNGKFVKMKKGEHKLGSPTAVCAVRGTEFTIGVSKGGNSKVELTEGKLDIRNPYGKVELEEGYSAETDLADEPETSKNKNNIKEWQSKSDKSIESDLDDQADKYGKHINKFKNESESDAKELNKLKDLTGKAKTKDDFALSGEKILNSELKNEDNMLLNEASKHSIGNLMKDYGESNAEIKNKLQEVFNMCSIVQEQQIKNQQAIKEVKEEYKKAYDSIMKKYKNDKSDIFKNLDDYKKQTPLKKDELTEGSGEK